MRGNLQIESPETMRVNENLSRISGAVIQLKNRSQIQNYLKKNLMPDLSTRKMLLDLINDDENRSKDINMRYLRTTLTSYHDYLSTKFSGKIFGQ